MRSPYNYFILRAKAKEEVIYSNSGVLGLGLENKPDNFSSCFNPLQLTNEMRGNRNSAED